MRVPAKRITSYYWQLTFIATALVSDGPSGKRRNWTYVASIGATFRPPEVVKILVKG